MKVEAAVLGSPSLIILMVSVVVKQHVKKLGGCVGVEVDVLGFPSPNSPYGLCGRKATLNSSFTARPNRQRLGVLKSCHTPTCAVLWCGVSACLLYTSPSPRDA